MQKPLRLIKKYPNRRLYDTKTSSYITLNDVKALVLAAETFKVQDAKTGEDLTRSILLQIIIEEETAGVPLFTTELLTQMIRFYGQPMQSMLGKYLETNMKSFSDFHQQLEAQSHLLYGENSGQVQNDLWTQFMNFQGPAMQTMMATFMDQSKKMLDQMQDQLKNQTLNMFSGIQIPEPVGEEAKKAESGGD
jgi:polyhydroxyalkanoate synthesis repressor PhaR